MKSNKVIKAVCLTILAIALSACEKEKKVIVEKLVPVEEKEKKQEIVVNDSMDAEELSLAAEQLITPNSFMYADKVLTQALAKDPTNFRAQFYKKMLAQPMLMKGMVTRTKGLFKNNKDVKYDEVPNVALKKFLLDGVNDIKTFSQLQDFLVQYRETVNDWRKFVKENVNQEFVVHLNPDVLKFNDVFDYRRSCYLKEEQNGNYVYECDTKEVYNVKLNAGDLTAISQILAGKYLYTILATSYTVDGIEKFVEKSTTNFLTNEQSANLLKSIPTLGLVRKDQAFTSIRSLGADLVSASKWVQQNMNALCPKGDGAFNQRRGFLFADGLCLGAKSEKADVLKVFESMIAGIAVVSSEDVNCNKRNVRINAFNVFENPVQDLRQLAPIKYNAYDKVSELADKSFGGVFVDNDAEDFMLEKNFDCDYNYPYNK